MKQWSSKWLCSLGSLGGLPHFKRENIWRELVFVSWEQEKMWVFKYMMFLFSWYVLIFMGKQVLGLVWFQSTLISKAEHLQVTNNDTCLYSVLIVLCFFLAGTGKIITLAWNFLLFEFGFNSFFILLVNTALVYSCMLVYLFNKYFSIHDKCIPFSCWITEAERWSPQLQRCTTKGNTVL